MKFNRSMLGGTIRKSNLEVYSRYFQKFLDAYKAEGVEINAITVQNEVDTTVDGRYAACLLAQENEILFVRKYLRPLLRKNGSPTKIWVLDHNFTLWGRAIAELSDAIASELGRQTGDRNVHAADAHEAPLDPDRPHRQEHAERVRVASNQPKVLETSGCGRTQPASRQQSQQHAQRADQQQKSAGAEMHE